MDQNHISEGKKRKKKQRRKKNPGERYIFQPSTVPTERAEFLNVETSRETKYGALLGV
jgi:hypothetical protein